MWMIPFFVIGSIIGVIITIIDFPNFLDDEEKEEYDKMANKK